MRKNQKNKEFELSGIPWGRRKLRTPKPKLPWAIEATPCQPTPTTRRGNAHLAKGQHAEQLALHYLQAQGLVLLHQNYRCKCGELDLLMAEGACAVVVEVRARSPTRHGQAGESITQAKQQRVARCAALWWVKEGQRKFKHLRFDVVAIQDPQPPQWIRSAWQY